MVIRARRSTIWLVKAARLLLLLPLSDLIAHDAIYANGWGVTGGGPLTHGYWPFFGLVVAILALTFLAAGARRARRLRGDLAGVPSSVRSHVTGGAAPGYHRELLSILAALIPLTAGFFLLQENAEAMLGGGAPIGLAPIVGPHAFGVLLVVALASLTVAMGGALVRWRIAVLEERLTRLRRAGVRRIRVESRPNPAWQFIAAACRQRWNLLREDLGRAPPALVRRLAG
jgi:hypothetical protein